MHTCQYIHISATKHANVIHIGLVEPTETNTSKHRQKVIAAQRSSEIAQIASSVVEPGSAELDNRRVGQPITYMLGGKISTILKFWRPEKNGRFCFTSGGFSGIEDFGVETLRGERSRSCWGGRVGISIKNSTQRRDGLFYSVFSRVNPVYIYIYSFKKHQAVKLSLGCICASLRSVILLLYQLAV